MRKQTPAGLLAATALGGGLLVGLLPAAAAAAPVNLIKNPGAEAAAGSNGGVVNVPNWARINGNFTAVKYGAPGDFPGKKSPGPSTRGKNFFAGGPQSMPGSSVATQTVFLKSGLGRIDAGHEAFTASGFFGGFGAESDNAGMEITFEDGQGNQTGDWLLGFQTAAQRHNKTGLFQRQVSAKVPVGSRKVFVQLIFDGSVGDYNDGYIDNVSLVLTSR
jgi:hypothetical protein